MEPARTHIANIWSRRLFRLVAVLFLPAVILAAEPVSSVPRRTKVTAIKSWSVRWQPMRVVNGAPLFLRVTAPVPLESLSGNWLKHEVFFSLDTVNKTWSGIAGSSLKTRPGSYVLKLAKYPRTVVQVAKQYTEPSPEQLQKVSQDTG